MTIENNINNKIDEKTLEKYRRIEYGNNYEYWWRKCDLCAKVTYYGSLYYLNEKQTIIVCLDCYYEFLYDQEVREFQRLYR